MRKLLLQLTLLPVLVCGLAACGPDYLKRYDKPLTYAEAIREKDIDFPLPPSSRNIHYGMYADRQAYTRLVRLRPQQRTVSSTSTLSLRGMTRCTIALLRIRALK